MKALLLRALVLVAGTGTLYADDQRGPPPIDKPIREAFERGDYETARRLLVQAYQRVPRPEYLFALGQVELNLENYQSAIDFYEKFLATRPDPEQAALAQQAIGAARMRLAAPEPEPVQTPPPPPPPPVQQPPEPERPRVPRRRWYTEDTGFVALGGGALLVGGGLLYYSHRLGTDRSGSLSDYDKRIELSRTTRWTGAGVAAAGALVIGVTMLRWRLRPDGGDLAASIAPGAATFAFTTRW